MIFQGVLGGKNWFYEDKMKWNDCFWKPYLPLVKYNILLSNIVYIVNIVIVYFLSFKWGIAFLSCVQNIGGRIINCNYGQIVPCFTGKGWINGLIPSIKWRSYSGIRITSNLKNYVNSTCDRPPFTCS